MTSARDLEYPQTFIRNLEYPLTSIKDLKYLLNLSNWSQVPYCPVLSKSLNSPHENTKRTGILLWRRYLKNLNLNLILTSYLILNSNLNKKLYKKL
jgi:hypothetical protein